MIMLFFKIKSLEKNNCKVIPLLGYNLTLKQVNQCDYIFCIYESVFYLLWIIIIKDIKNIYLL